MATVEQTALESLLAELSKPVQGSQPRETPETEPGGLTTSDPPLVRLARSSAITASAALDELDTNEALALRQLESNRAAALERITPSDPDAVLPPLHDAALAEVQVHAESLSASIRTSAQRKRVALQAHAVAADAALEEALSLAGDIADLDESSYSIDHVCALKSRLTVARLATAALPTVPLHGTYMTLSRSSTAALRAMQCAVSREDGVAVLRAAAESALGILLTHRGHVHSAACEHEAGPVLEAAKEGDVPELVAALESGCSSEEMDSFGCTALWWAARNGHLEAARALVSVGADPSVPDRVGRFPLQEAAGGNHAGIVSLLLVDPRIDVNAVARSGATALHSAAANNRPVIVILLLADPRVDPNLADMLGLTPMHAAIVSGCLEAVQALAADPRVHVHAPFKGKEAPHVRARQLVFEPSRYYMTPARIREREARMAIAALLEEAAERAGRV